MADFSKFKDSNNNVYNVKDTTARSGLLDKVDKTLTIAGIQLDDNITVGQLLTALGVESGAQVNLLERVAINGVIKNIQNKIVNIVKSDIISLLGPATASNDGYFSKEDFAKFNTLYQALVESTSDTFTDTLQEILQIFSEYPEGTNIMEVLNEKQPKMLSANIEIDGETSGTVEGALNRIATTAEYVSNKATTFNNNVDDDEKYPSAKLVYDYMQTVIARVATLESDLKIQGVENETLIIN